MLREVFSTSTKRAGREVLQLLKNRQLKNHAGEQNYRFPMNFTWLKGKISTEEMQNEHPLELERLKKKE